MPMGEEGITTGELEDIVGTAAAEFSAEESDSGPDPDEDHPEVEEEAEEPDEDDESAEEDVEDVDPESEEESDESEEDEEDDEEDEDTDEDDDSEEDEESEDDEEDEEDEEPELHPVKIDGEEKHVSLDELKAGYQRHEDYTRKTQRVADVYRKMEQWYEQRANNPQGWIAEIASGQENPAQTIAEALTSAGDPTVLTGQVLRHLVEKDQIAEELVEALNLQEVAERAKEESVHHEVQTLKQQLQQRDQQAAQEAQRQQVENQIRQQWNETVQRHGLEFESQETEYQEFLNTLEFARDNGIPNVEHAYVLRSQLASGQEQKAKPAKKKSSKKKAESAVKKRKTAAMSRKPTGGGKAKSSSKNKGGDIVDEAAAEALEEIGLDL